ncbi:MAG: hypothetical protein AB7F59_05065 [Bdellovibrionales bacterium]
MKNSRMPFLILIFSTIFLMSIVAFAAKGGRGGFLLRPMGMYWTDSFNDGGQASGDQATKTVNTRTDMMVALGYLTDMGLFIGGTYYNGTHNTQESLGDATTSDTKRTYQAYGPTLGFAGDMFYIFGTYHLAPLYTTGTDSLKTTFTGGTGYQVDIGVTFWFNGQIGLGPQLTYYTATYTKQQGSTGVAVDLPATANHAFFRPILAFTFMF